MGPPRSSMFNRSVHYESSSYWAIPMESTGSIQFTMGIGIGTYQSTVSWMCFRNQLQLEICAGLVCGFAKSYNSVKQPLEDNFSVWKMWTPDVRTFSDRCSYMFIDGQHDHVSHPSQKTKTAETARLMTTKPKYPKASLSKLLLPCIHFASRYLPLPAGYRSQPFVFW